MKFSSFTIVLLITVQGGSVYFSCSDQLIMCSCLQNILNWIVYASYTDFKTKQYLENVAFCFDIHSILNSLMQKVNQVFNIYIDKSVRKWLRWKQTLPLIDNHSECILQILILFILYYFAFVVKRVTWEYTNKLLSDKIYHKPQTQSAADWNKKRVFI